jgi:hypothetical protein
MLRVHCEMKSPIFSRALAFCMDRFGYIPNYHVSFDFAWFEFRSEEDLSLFLLTWSKHVIRTTS